MKAKNIGILIVIFLALIIFFSAAFTVDETEQVIITQFGKPVGEPIMEAGIHFKLPIIQNKHVFDKRFLEWDGDANQIPTMDKRFIWVDSYARWRISDPLLFFKRVQNERGAHTRLDDILDGETRNAVARHKLVEIVRSTNRTPMRSADSLSMDEQKADVFIKIKTGRSEITGEILAAAKERAKELGIELLDLQLKRIDYVEDVRRKVYERMITERKRIADKFRSEGKGEASKILGNKERELKGIQSAAYRQAQVIIGKADAEATTIYARAYNRSADTRDFYRFLKTLESYKNTLSEKDILILSTKSDFFIYLESESGR